MGVEEKVSTKYYYLESHDWYYLKRGPRQEGNSIPPSPPVETPIPFYPKQLPQSTSYSMDMNWRECRAKFFTSFQHWHQSWACSCPADTGKQLGQVAFGSTQQRQPGAVSGTGGEPRARTGNHKEHVVSSGQADHRTINNIREWDVFEGNWRQHIFQGEQSTPAVIEGLRWEARFYILRTYCTWKGII